MTQKQMRTTSLVYPYDPMSALSSSRMAEVFAALTWGFDVVGTFTSLDVVAVVVVVVVVVVVDVVVVVIASTFVTFACKTCPPIVVPLSEEFTLPVASVVKREALLLGRVTFSLSVVKGPALEGPGSGTLVKFLPAVAVTSTTDTSVSITVVVTLLSVGMSVTPPRSELVVFCGVPSPSVLLEFVDSRVVNVAFAASPGFCVVVMFVVSLRDNVVFPTTSPDPDAVTCVQLWIRDKATSG